VQLVPVTCPRDLRWPVRRNEVPGMTHVLVPGAPTGLVLCGPKARVGITGPGEVQTIVATLDALRRVPPGVVYACPIDVGPIYGFFFNYPGGEVLLVTVHASGCRQATNGRVAAWAASIGKWARHRLAYRVHPG